jgi:putative effector of murein hydrolase LrgA (UPF0299 family)
MHQQPKLYVLPLLQFLLHLWIAGWNVVGMVLLGMLLCTRGQNKD